jgi:hypothetical protein
MAREVLLMAGRRIGPKGGHPTFDGTQFAAAVAL